MANIAVNSLIDTLAVTEAMDMKKTTACATEKTRVDSIGWASLGAGFPLASLRCVDAVVNQHVLHGFPFSCAADESRHSSAATNIGPVTAPTAAPAMSALDSDLIGVDADVEPGPVGCAAMDIWEAECLWNKRGHIGAIEALLGLVEGSAARLIVEDRT
ncbi:hypothetical protein ETB97_008520 [Aspergillus alliaceus]|uniref:Uncharacterized protein n=1 Tax=Petromyces alliaceus TaxID=209559 RepID=A0A8H6AAG8_PETAA|nr:hypothetical protein ETB97_008520 [Aspergillus burnettii]